MYLVTNITQEITFECDAIETIKAIDGRYVATELINSDGFKALTIVHVSPSEEYYTEEVFVYEDHYLTGIEDTGSFEYVPDPEDPEDT